MKRKFINLVAVVLSATIGTGLLYSCKSKTPSEFQIKEDNQQVTAGRSGSVGGTNFVSAAKLVTPGVVHIQTVYPSQTRASPFQPFGGGSAPAMGSGSGVVIGSDGYIATNNHVVENAIEIEVVLPDRRRFAAKMIGRDPNTDLALLKVDAKDLPVVELGNSDNVEIGEWVLAVGYPYSLNTTVTAGIISAKGRSIGIINRTAPAASSRGELQGNTAIESFIQTDAAINPGNSGGALVDMNGKLIGINTAIASLTGSYAGYAFAIPVNLAQKILSDLKEFGAVKRGILGVSFPAPSVEENYLKQQGINPGSVKGVFITGIQEGSAADNAGLKEGDIIQSIDGVKLYSSSEFSERIARHRPGDKVKLEYLRNGKTQSTSVTLKGEESRKPLAASQSLQDIYDRLGAKFAPIPPAFKERYDLSGGVVVTDVAVGGFFYQVGVLPGTIIVLINNKVVNSPEDINEAMVEAGNGRIQVLGIAPDGSRVAFSFSLGT
jgi:Do/DeqQ family serine protease